MLLNVRLITGTNKGSGHETTNRSYKNNNLFALGNRARIFTSMFFLLCLNKREGELGPVWDLCVPQAEKGWRLVPTYTD